MESQPRSMRAPAIAGPTIWAMDIKDWLSPSTTPCSPRPTCWVMRLVSAGRMSPFPSDEKVAASKSVGTTWLIPRMA